MESFCVFVPFSPANGGPAAQNNRTNQFRFSPTSPGTILAGSLSSMRNEANQLYLRLSPDKANWIKFSNCGNPLLEKPVKVLEIFKLMLLGLGYTIKQPLAIKNAMKKSASVGLVLNEPTNSCLIDFFTH